MSRASDALEPANDVTGESLAELRVRLQWAELDLKSGNCGQALTVSAEVLAVVGKNTPLGRQARHLRGLALESDGDYAGAAAFLEELVVDYDDVHVPLELQMALCRCYRVAGELVRACEYGENAMAQARREGLHGTPAGVKLLLTLAGAEIERGNLDYAARLCRRALGHAEKLQTPEDLAGCYWNASVVETRRWNYAEAARYADRAMALLDQVDSVRYSAQLRATLGLLKLRQSPPQIDEGLSLLDTAERELRSSDASPSDLVGLNIARARAYMLRGEFERARREVSAALTPSGLSPLVRAEALVLRGEIAFGCGNRTDAVSHFRQAIAVLNTLGADRGAGQLWFDLGRLWRDAGCMEEAATAFQRGGEAAGLGTPATQPLRRLTAVR